MSKVLLLLILHFFVLSTVQSQSFTVNELIRLAYMPSKDIDAYLKKKGFYFQDNDADSISSVASFLEKQKSNKKAIACKRSIDICIKNESKSFTLYTTALNEYQLGQQALIKSGFFYDTAKNLLKENSIIFQKANITIKASKEVADSITTYRFHLLEKVIPSSLSFAEDLLQFDSHQFIVSYFGEANVKKDQYYLTESELKRCSVLFNGTQRQAIFVWNDEIYLKDLAYIIITNKLPTEGGLKNNPLSGNNEWQLQNGVYPGMSLKDLLILNEIDFSIYGNKSELAFLVKPEESGKINFNKTALMLSCHRCFDDKIFNQKEVSALSIVKANLPMKVFDIVLYPSKR